MSELIITSETVIFVDISGSSSLDGLEKSFNKVKEIVGEGQTAEVIPFDYKILQTMKCSWPISNEEIYNLILWTQRGGTDYQPIFDLIIEQNINNNQNIKNVIIISDGYANNPTRVEEMNCQITWIIFDNYHEKKLEFVKPTDKLYMI